MKLLKLDLKSKLFVVLIVTLSFILALSFVLLFKAAEEKKNLEATKNRIIEAEAISRVIHFMQKERGLIIGLIASENINSSDSKLLLAMNDLDKAIENAKATYAKPKIAVTTL